MAMVKYKGNNVNKISNIQWLCSDYESHTVHELLSKEITNF